MAPPSTHLEPPRFTVDLSLPPRARYKHIGPHFQSYLSSSDTSLTGLYKSLIDEQFAASPMLANALHLLSHIVFTRLYDKQETAELRGISDVTQIPMYILVAFNCLLDLLMGCTSGGMRMADEAGTRLVHFRTLDWSMDELRPLTVELDFIRSAESGDQVVATSITYFGYVGILTGVRKGLSVSLNFRPHHDRSTRLKALRFRAHQAMVLLGWRRGVSSLLRGLILEHDSQSSQSQPHNEEKMSKILGQLPSQPSTAAYLILCTPQRVYNIEKDNSTGIIFSSATFQTTCNHDRRDEANPAYLQAAVEEQEHTVAGMENIVAWSIDRKLGLDEKHKRAVARRCRKEGRPFDESAGVTLRSVVAMIMDPDISNEETQFSAIMDPGSGKVIWRRMFEAMLVDDGFMDD